MNKSIVKREQEFQSAYKEWKETNNKEAWNIMFYRIYDCCHNIMAKQLIGVRIDPEDFENKLYDATLYVCKRLKENMEIGKLSSYCYLVCKGRLHNPRAQFNDKISYYDNIFETIEMDDSRSVSLEIEELFYDK